MEGALAVGLTYYAQWKVTEDDLGLSIGQSNGLLSNKHRVYGLGPEIMLPIAGESKLFGFLTLRYLWETGARLTLEGNTFVAQLTFPVPSIALQ